MKIKQWNLAITWEDGTTDDLSSYVPNHIIEAVEDFLDYWEVEYGTNELETTED